MWKEFLKKMKILIKNLLLVLSWIYSQQRVLGISYKCNEKNVGVVYLTANQDFISDNPTIGKKGNFKLSIFTPETLSFNGLIAEIHNSKNGQQIFDGLNSIQAPKKLASEELTALSNVIINFISEDQIPNSLPKNWQFGIWKDHNNHEPNPGKIYDRNGYEIKVFDDFTECWISIVESLEMRFMKSVNANGKLKLCLTLEECCDDSKMKKIIEPYINRSLPFNNIQDVLKFHECDISLLLLLFYSIDDERILRQLPGNIKRVKVINKDTHECKEDIVEPDNPEVEHESIILKITIDSQVYYVGLRLIGNEIAYKITTSEAACDEKTDYISSKEQSKTILCLLEDILHQLIPNWELLPPETYESKILSMQILQPAILFIFKMPIRLKDYPHIVKLYPPNHEYIDSPKTGPSPKLEQATEIESYHTDSDSKPKVNSQENPRPIDDEPHATSSRSAQPSLIKEATGIAPSHTDSDSKPKVNTQTDP